MNQKDLLPLKNNADNERLCLLGKLSSEDIELFKGDREISERRHYFSIIIIPISLGMQLVGVYADPQCWECVFDEFQKGVMANFWKDTFQKAI